MLFKGTVIFFLAVGLASAQNGYQYEGPRASGYDYAAQNYENDEQFGGGEIPGEPGQDYPVYAEVPETSFSCENQEYPGYYADPEAQCQAFYICQRGGRSDAFLCPNGTVFNQEYLVCDWWYNFDCSRAESLYGVNEQIVRAMEEADARLAQQGGYKYEQSSLTPDAAYGVPSQNGYTNGNGKSNGNGHYTNGNGNGNGHHGNGNGYHKNGNGNGNGHYKNGNGNGHRANGNGHLTNDFNGSGYKNGGNGNGHHANGNGNGHHANGNGNGHHANGNGNGDYKNGNGFHANNGYQSNGNGQYANGNGNGPLSNAPKPVYGAPNAFNGFSQQDIPVLANGFSHGNGNGHRNGNGHFNGNGNGFKNGNGHYNGNGNGKSNGYQNGNGFGQKNGYSNGNGNGNGLAPKQTYGAPFGNNGFRHGNSANVEKSYLPPNGNGKALSAYKNGLGNGPSSQYGAPEEHDIDLNEPNAYNGVELSDEYGAPQNSYLPPSKK